MNQFEQDIIARYHEKLAALTNYMEKDATPTGTRYMQAAAKRGLNRAKANQALDKFIRSPKGPQNKNDYAQALAEVNLGAAGNKVLNDISGGVVGAMRDGTIQQNGGYLLPDSAINDLWQARGASEINPKYLSKLTGIKDKNILAKILNSPQSFIE